MIGLAVRTGGARLWMALPAALAAAPVSAWAGETARNQAPAVAEEKVFFPPPPASWPKPIHDNATIGYVLFDQLEYRDNEGDDTLTWDVDAWLGNDWNKLWIKTEGDHTIPDEDSGEAELQLLYARLITPFWYFQVGGRYDQIYGDEDDSRFLSAIGFEGLAPYQYDIEPTLFISEDGDVSASFEATYDMLLTQRLILQPRLETEVAVQDVEEFGVGEGFNNVGLDLRLRYEIRREFAPYIGVSWTRLLGNTADFAEEEGEEDDDLALVAGLRLWF